MFVAYIYDIYIYIIHVNIIVVERERERERSDDGGDDLLRLVLEEEEGKGCWGKKVWNIESTVS